MMRKRRRKWPKSNNITQCHIQTYSTKQTREIVKLKLKQIQHELFDFIPNKLYFTVDMKIDDKMQHKNIIISL